MPNKFYIQPANLSQGLSGLSEAVGIAGERKREEDAAQAETDRIDIMKQGALDIMENGTEEDMRKYVVANPEMAQTIKTATEMKFPGSGDKIGDSYFAAAIDPTRSSGVFNLMQEQANADGVITPEESAKMDEFQTLLKDDPVKAQDFIKKGLYIFGSKEQVAQYEGFKGGGSERDKSTVDLQLEDDLTKQKIAEGINPVRARITARQEIASGGGPDVGTWGQPKEGIGEGGTPVSYVTNKEGEVKVLEGVTPSPKKGMKIYDPNTGNLMFDTTGGGAKSKKYSEVQTKSGGMANRVEAANKISFELEDKEGFNVSSTTESLIGGIPGVGSMMSSSDRQVYNTAKLDFITAVLRLESGAAIADSEFVKEDKKYFPQPGDKPAVIKNKRKARERQLDILKVASGGAYEEMRKAIEEKEKQKQNKNAMNARGDELSGQGLSNKEVVAQLRKEGYL